MKLLNVGCGGHRPGPPWINLDTLKESLRPGTPEMENLLKEPNYIECNLLKQSIDFPDQTFDGILLQHVLEHFTCHETTEVLGKCRAVLRTGGLLVASVPNSDFFLQCYEEDTVANAVTLFGEPISESQYTRFFDYALFHRDHKQILNPSSLLCLILRAGFKFEDSYIMHPYQHVYYSSRFLPASEERDMICRQLNRPKFSTIVGAYK